MRKLLVLLSVVLLFALCQSQVMDKKKLVKPICPFGYTKVNGAKVCRSYKDYLKNPRNATNCTKNFNLKCRKFENKTLCFCFPKFIVPPFGNISKCQPGEIFRCKLDRTTGKRDCKCSTLLPKIKDKTELDCPLGTYPKCKGRRCICAKNKEREPSIPVPVVPKPEPVIY